MRKQALDDWGMMLVVTVSLVLFMAACSASAKEVVSQASGTVVQSESKDNIILSRSAEGSLVTVELKLYSEDHAAPRWVLSSSEIETLKMKLNGLPKSSRVDVPDWSYISVTNFNNSESFPYSTVYIVNNRVVLVNYKGERSYYVDTKEAGEWLRLLAGNHVPSSMYSRSIKTGTGVAMVVRSSGDTDPSGIETAVKNPNMMEYAPYLVVVLILILFAYLAFKRPKTEGA